jgi:CBS domain-containing protein
MMVRDAMTRDVRVANPDETIQQAARAMEALDSGVLPVGENDRLVGMITDRDIAIRAIAHGMGPECKVREVMSAEVKYCFEDQDLDEVADNMGELQVRRLPVIDHDKRLVGILSLADIATCRDSAPAADALSRISRPGGLHSQSA